MLIVYNLVSFVFSPENWLFFFIALFLLLRNKKWKKRMGWLGLLVLVVFSDPMLFRWAYKAWEVKQPALGNQYAAIILPGGIADYDVQGRGYFNRASDRFIQTALLYKSGRANYIIVTGGNGFLNRDIPPEALFLQSALDSLHIPPEKIITETRSRSTRENALFSKKKADSLGLSGPMVLVTSAMHMRRCLAEFQKAGLEVQPYSCNYEVLDTDVPFYEHLWPDLGLPNAWGRLLKEWLGYAVVRFR